MESQHTTRPAAAPRLAPQILAAGIPRRPLTLHELHIHHEPPLVSRWARDDALCQISARDARGQVLMAIHAGPDFAARLAAAFCARPAAVAADPNASWNAASPR